MYSAWSTSWISGAVTAAAMAVAIAAEEGIGSNLEAAPDLVLAIKSLAAMALAGGVVVIAVRVGLHLARCRELGLRYVLCIPAFSLLIAGLVLAAPLETYGALVDMPTTERDPPGIQLEIWAILLGIALVPLLISYAIGRLAGTRKLPPNTSFERTREG